LTFQLINCFQILQYIVITIHSFISAYRKHFLISTGETYRTNEKLDAIKFT